MEFTADILIHVVLLSQPSNHYEAQREQPFDFNGGGGGQFNFTAKIEWLQNKVYLRYKTKDASMPNNSLSTSQD